MAKGLRIRLKFTRSTVSRLVEYSQAPEVACLNEPDNHVKKNVVYRKIPLHPNKWPGQEK